jgi:hypothetical protein
LHHKINKKAVVAVTTTLELYHALQKNHEYSTNVPIQLGTINQLGNMISEKNFAGNSEYIFSLALTDGLPTLNVQ